VYEESGEEKGEVRKVKLGTQGRRTSQAGVQKARSPWQGGGKERRREREWGWGRRTEVAEGISVSKTSESKGGMLKETAGGEGPWDD